jgi:hypothetical protein
LPVEIGYEAKIFATPVSCPYRADALKGKNEAYKTFLPGFRKFRVTIHNSYLEKRNKKDLTKDDK